MRRRSLASLLACSIPLAALIVACAKPREDWKERTGPGFVITAPANARHLTKPIADGVVMNIYEYRDGVTASWQVQITELPEDRTPTSAIVTMRDELAAKAKITREEDVAMGDAAGKDLRAIVNLAPFGEVNMRTRIIVQNHRLYQVMALHPVGRSELEAAANRFVDSFKLAEPSQDPLARLEAANPGSKVYRAVGSVDETGWYSARSVNGRFAVQAPGILNEVETDIDLGRMYMIATQKLPERIRFTAMCVVSDKPQGRDDFVAKLGAIESRRDREFKGRPAVEVESAGNASALAVFEKQRMCMLSVEPISNTTPRPVADVRRFFDSLELEN